jgi:hypothetical protein
MRRQCRPCAHRHVGHASCATKRLANDFHLGIKVTGGVEVLPGTAAAACGNKGTRLGNAIGRPLNNAAHDTAGEVLFGFDDVDVDEFARQPTLDKHHAAVGQARQTVASGNEPLDSCRFHSH